MTMPTFAKGKGLDISVVVSERRSVGDASGVISCQALHHYIIFHFSLNSEPVAAAAIYVVR